MLTTSLLTSTRLQARVTSAIIRVLYHLHDDEGWSWRAIEARTALAASTLFLICTRRREIGAHAFWRIITNIPEARRAVAEILLEE